MDHHLAGRPEDLHPKDKPTVLRAAASEDIVVACLGEKTYCETPGNIDYLTLDEAQLRLIEALANT